MVALKSELHFKVWTAATEAEDKTAECELPGTSMINNGRGGIFGTKLCELYNHMV